MTTRAAPPNVIVVLADDMGWGDPASYGSRISTPQMDRLAREGVQLTDAHAAAAVCTPSRYALLTGRFAWRSPLRRGVLGPHGPAIIEGDRHTIASVLRTAGYATGAFGKWHLGLGWFRKEGPPRTAFSAGSDLAWDPWAAEDDNGFDIDYAQPFIGGPLDLGFDRFFGISGSLDMPPYCFLDQDRTLGIPLREKECYFPGQRRGLQVEGWRDDAVDVRFVEEACRWLDQQARAHRPFFLYLATSAPHRPCVPPEFIRGVSDAGPRADSVCLVDWMLGRLLARIDENQLADDTIIIVTSDNGATTMFAEDTVRGHAPNGSHRGQKADAWEGGHREPFYARWPDQIPPGSRRDAPICLTDVMPTIARAAGAALPIGAAPDGVDILDVLTGHASGDPDRILIHHSNDGVFAVRQGPWKAIFGTGSGGFSSPRGHAVGAYGAGQLYNLHSDPGETTNLWNSAPVLVALLHQRLERQRQRDGQI